MLDRDNRPERRTALIARELQLFGIEIEALQETRFEAQGQLQEEDYTFFWVGKTVGTREAGVTFAVHNTIAKRLTSLPTAVSPRLMSKRVPIEKGRYLTLVNVYAPTMTYSVEKKEIFYQELTHIVLKFLREDKLLILGDFNARVGTDWETYKGIIGKFGKKKKNSNGELLLNFCAQQELSITNTFFYQPDKNYYTWKHPRSDHYHLLDYAITRKANLADVLCTKAMRGPECSTDHYLVRCQLRMKITLPRRKTPASTKLKKLDISKLTNPEHCRELTRAIEAALESVQPAGEEIEQRWKALKEAVYSASRKTLGHPHRKTAEWFWEHG